MLLLGHVLEVVTKQISKAMRMHRCAKYIEERTRPSGTQYFRVLLWVDMSFLFDDTFHA